MRTETLHYVVCPNCSTEFVLPQPVNGTKIRSAKDLVPLIAYYGHEEKETFRVILLNGRNTMLGIETISVGSVNKVGLRTGEIFTGAIRKGAAAIMLVHNHPSGDVAASLPDIALTKEVEEAGKLLQIPVVDHIILGRNGTYLSFREKGMLNAYS